VLEEGMMEVECPSVTPEIVLKASGHVDRFNDLMTKDVKTQDCFRADHLLKGALEASSRTGALLTLHAAHLEAALMDPLLAAPRKAEMEDALARLDEFKASDMDTAFANFGVKARRPSARRCALLTSHNSQAPETKNDLTPVFEFNLMFATHIGPSGMVKGYMRPETAQGIFVNFRDLLYHNGGKLPFACAQIGQSFRNEIAPRAGLLRVREFTQAEIEHFVHPEHKEHPRFAEVAHLTLNLFSQAAQLSESRAPLRMTIGEAVERKIVANQTLGYFVARCYLFLVRLGVDEKRLRFRQHLEKEMAHYAEDCWDAEIECSYGWIECVGMADRSAFDLTAHAAKSKVDLTAFEKFSEPREVTELHVEPNKQLLGKELKKEAKAVTDALAALSEADALALRDRLAADGSAEIAGCRLTAEMVKIELVTKMVSGRSFTPGVIEPSFGIGRIMYCLFEHCFYWRDGDEQRLVLRLKPLVAPIKVTVFPLLSDERLVARTSGIASQLTGAGIFNKVDSTGVTIGKRYARTDEIGVPFAITIDHRTLDDETVTVRERDSCDQIRVPTAEVVDLIAKLVGGAEWAATTAGYPKQTPTKEDE